MRPHSSLFIRHNYDWDLYKIVECRTHIRSYMEELTLQNSGSKNILDKYIFNYYISESILKKRVVKFFFFKLSFFTQNT